MDRQIGDRRGQNSYECRVQGPSKDFPAGPDMMDLQVKLLHEKVVVVITDCKDYYHQLWASPARASTNAVGPSLHREMLKDTSAYSAFVLASALARRNKREVRGDDLHSFPLHPGECPTAEPLPEDHLWVCFGSILALNTLRKSLQLTPPAVRVQFARRECLSVSLLPFGRAADAKAATQGPFLLQKSCFAIVGCLRRRSWPHDQQLAQRGLLHMTLTLSRFFLVQLVSKALAERGFSVGPPLDIGISTEYDLRFVHVMHWLTFLLAEKRLKAIMVSPPCTTFSNMRKPRLRSADVPFGFDLADPQTSLGNILGQRGAQLMYTAATNEAAGVMETTFSSYLKHLPGWKAVKGLRCADEVRCDSCRFGSIHLKPFRFLSVNVGIKSLALRCMCEGPHVQIEGAYTKASATYVPNLVSALADCFAEAIAAVKQRHFEALSLEVAGLENQLVNEIALSSPWKVQSSWTFKKQSHINILEEASVLRLVNFLSRCKKPVRAVALVDSPGACAMPIFPRTAGERAKAAQRAARPPVPSGRPVLATTQQKRLKLLDEFLFWSIEEGVDMLAMLSDHGTHIDEINLILERYGRALYESGKSYAKYAETINSITNWKPAIRRMLQGAWDFGFSWNRHEPTVHHSAMPGAVALAIITTGILWGWTHFSGCIALMWAGLLRPGELLAAKRGDFLLPCDGDQTIPFGLLAINEPKTRFSAARHQSSKIDAPDLLRVVELFLGPLQPHQKLWPLSGGTLRSRFRSVLSALKLPLTTFNGARPLELASIRAGSATWLIQVLENGDLLQRRGRWANRRMMEIYVQEMSALLYLRRVPLETNELVLSIASSFLEVIQKADAFVKAKIPALQKSWPVMGDICIALLYRLWMGFNQSRYHRSLSESFFRFLPLVLPIWTVLLLYSFYRNRSIDRSAPAEAVFWDEFGRAWARDAYGSACFALVAEQVSFAAMSTAGSQPYYRDDEVIVDRDGIPHYTGAVPGLMREYRQRVLFAFNNLEGDGKDEAEEARDLAKKKQRFGKRLLDALHGEAYKACEDLMTQHERLKEPEGYKHIFAALQTIEKVNIVKRTEAFDKFFDSSHRKRGQPVDLYIRQRKQQWSELQDVAENVQMSEDLRAYFLLKHVGISREDRRTVLLANQSNYTMEGIEKALRTSFYDLHEKERQRDQSGLQKNWGRKGSSGRGMRSYAAAGSDDTMSSWAAVSETVDEQVFEDDEAEEAYAVDDNADEMALEQGAMDVSDYGASLLHLEGQPKEAQRHPEIPWVL
eukprot:s1186_g3.t1